MFSPYPLLIAAASVGILHMSAPDHWATLLMLGRTSGWNRNRLLGVGVITAAGHVGLSILLGLVIVEVGIAFSQQVSVYITLATGAIMVAGGIAYAVRELAFAKPGEDLEPVGRVSPTENTRKGVGYFAVLGAALSPDLSILPIFLLAVPIGLGFAVDAAIVFAFASIASLLIFLELGFAGLAKAFERVPPKYNDALLGVVVAAVGAYVLVAG